MEKRTAETLMNGLSSLLDYLRQVASPEHHRETLAQASGSLGFLLKLLGKPVLDGYFNHRTQERLANGGFYIYAQAAFTQAHSSLFKLGSLSSEEADPDLMILGIEKEFVDQLSTLAGNSYAPFWQPEYHPVVVMIKEAVINTLRKLLPSESMINAFQKDFNENINQTTEQAFGDDYKRLQETLDHKWLKLGETRLLNDQIEQARIGFSSDESLGYEEALGEWRPMNELSSGEQEDNSAKEPVMTGERGLVPVEKMIEDYFNRDPNLTLEMIFFLVVDFGKGKSVFLRRYAAKLALEYAQTGEGYIPVYFNLRNFDACNDNTGLGPIYEFLHTRYAIELQKKPFKHKRFIFLIDSLDEDGNLNKKALEDIIGSIKRIQLIDRNEVRHNRIVVATRPIDKGLVDQICRHHPQEILKGQRLVGHYASLYGFTKDQFNHWMNETLAPEFQKAPEVKKDAFMHEAFQKIKGHEHVDFYKLFSERSQLTASELRRPIFAYMIYQLLRNDINITIRGNVDIYLSFLNLLTKEAKYLHEPGIEGDIREQFEARSLFHQIAALWTSEKQKGGHACVHKADICRMIGDHEPDQKDEDVLEQHRNDPSSLIHILGHSYLDDHKDQIHFKHQSFAEMFMAEFYIKALVTCAIEQPHSLERAARILKVGIPTSQTMEFFQEILLILKETVCHGKMTPVVRERRKLILPLLATMAVNPKDQLHCPTLRHTWFDKYMPAGEVSNVPDALVENWCIDKPVLDKVIRFCADLIEFPRVYIHSKSTEYKVLANERVTHIENPDFTQSVFLDKYIALVAGNNLANSGCQFFIRRFSTDLVMRLLKEASFPWLRSQFRGMVIGDDDSQPLVLKHLDLHAFDLSHTLFQNLTIRHCTFEMCRFDGATFRNLHFASSDAIVCILQNVILEGLVDVSGLRVDEAIALPGYLTQKICATYDERLRNGTGDLGINPDEVNATYMYAPSGKAGEILTTFLFYLQYALRDRLITREDIFRAFIIMEGEDESPVAALIKQVVEKELTVNDTYPFNLAEMTSSDRRH